MDDIYIDKQFLQVSGLCGVPFASYFPNLATQIYKAQHGDAIFVPFEGHKYDRRDVRETIWNSILFIRATIFGS